LIDRVEIYVKAGDGGDGVVSFRREKFVPRGGPDGGNGGHGGSVYLVGKGSLNTLLSFKYKKHWRAEDGANGQSKKKAGKMGKDLLIDVPLGTQVQCKEADKKEALLADIVAEGQRVLVAQGGKGGWGNAHYATSTNQAPRTAEQGTSGEEVRLLLDLKLIADVGIVGYPNAGKSTLLSAVSKARPKIADYPFTTTEPVLGVVDRGYQSFVMADIPGIIEGAHEGRGLGFDFLRHIERTKVLIHLIDGTSAKPMADLKGIEAELELYQPLLKDRPRIIAINKIDLPEVQSRLPHLEQEFKTLGVRVYFISAASREGVEELMKKTLELVSKAGSPVETKKEPEAEYKVFHPRPFSPKKGGRREEKHGRG
jgi:GTP-binding protein